MQQMEINGSSHEFSGFISGIVAEMKSLMALLKPLSKEKTQMGNSLINKLLMSANENIHLLFQNVLEFVAGLGELNSANVLVLTIVSRVIASIKFLENDRTRKKQIDLKSHGQVINRSVSLLVHTIVQLKSRTKEADMILRVIQITYSLIDCNMLRYCDQALLTRMYSICFDCSRANPIIQSISISALYALTEIVFENCATVYSLQILTEFLEYVLKNKKVQWIQNQTQRGVVWELIVIAVQKFPTSGLRVMVENKGIIELINQMYRISIEQAFNLTLETTVVQSHKNMQAQKGTNVRRSLLSEFMRYYKSYVYLSIHLAIKVEGQMQEIVPFRESLSQLRAIYYLERTNRLYIFCEGVSLLILEGSGLLVQDERALILLDLFSQITEELHKASIPIEIIWEGGDFYLQKMCGDTRKIGDSDFIKIIKNTIVRLRKRLQGEGSSKNLTDAELQKARIDDKGNKIVNGFGKNWQRMIKSVIRIIRYLTSLNLKEGYNDQVVRKLIIQLQYWLLICPSHKTRNMILHEWLRTSSAIETKMQAIKASQCLQLGSNIIFAYSHIIDNVGLSILIKMLASVRISWEEGRGFEELDEVCLMADRLYSEQNLIDSEKSFNKAIRGFVQCCNSLLADMQQPPLSQEKRKKTGRSPQDRLIKMIDYVLGKLRAVLLHCVVYVEKEWNFLTAFWICFCSNKNEEIRVRTMSHLWYLFPALLKKGAVRQEEIISPYLELAKFQNIQISKLIVTHVKQLLISFSEETAIMQIFNLIKVMLETKNLGFRVSLYELQQMLIKESIYLVKSHEKIVSIIESLFFISKDTNEEYMTVSLLWNISDHIKALCQSNSLQESRLVWKHLFDKINSLAMNSTHPQTKQSCIHALTQIVAECTAVLERDFLFEVVKGNFLWLFCYLVSMEEGPAVQQAEMAHAAIKNYIKIIKKCVTDKMSDLNVIIDLSIERVREVVLAKGSLASVQYYYQICFLLQFWNGIQSTSEQNCLDREGLVRLVEEMGRGQQSFDKTSLFWRKKYQPMFDELKGVIIKQ